MATTPREVGTLIVVILKARNLPNKRHIGKQDPYCAVDFNRDKRRTKSVRRGGQHPEWDEEIRFTLFEEDNDSSQPSRSPGGTPPPPPPKNDQQIKGKKEMRVACYADDPKEPELIGEAIVDLTEVLTTGETDEWFTLLSKEKYCGEVYLELTFWSNDKPPENRPTPQASVINPNYGGPGSFTPIASTLHHRLRTSSESDQVSYRFEIAPASHASIPPELRPSTSLSSIDLYSPVYERRDRAEASEHLDLGGITNGMAELGVKGISRRRESFPPVRNTATPVVHSLPYNAREEFRPVSSMSVAPSFSSVSTRNSYSSQMSTSSYGYTQPVHEDQSAGYSRHFSQSSGFAPPWVNYNSNGQAVDNYSPAQTPYPMQSLHGTNSRPMPAASGIFGPPSSELGPSQMPPSFPQAPYPTHLAYPPVPPASAPPIQPYANPLPPPLVPPLSNSAPPPTAPPSNISLPPPPTSPLRASSPNHQHHTPPINGRPLPDPYGQLPHAHHAGTISGPPVPGSVMPARPFFPTPGPPPPPPAPARRSSLPFQPPPPPPPLPNATVTYNGSPAPSNSFDFSHMPQPPSLHGSTMVPPPPPPLHHLHRTPLPVPTAHHQQVFSEPTIDPSARSSHESGVYF